MRPDVEELKGVNPIAEKEGRAWAASNMGLQVKQRATQQLGVMEFTTRKPPRRRLTAGAAFSIGVVAVALVAVPFLLIANDGSNDSASITPQIILADGVVTTDEVKAAGEAVVKCMQDQGVTGSFSLQDDIDQGIFSHRGIQYDVPSEDENILNACRAEHMGQPVENGVRYEIEQRWDSQNQPTAGELFAFYDKVVQCTEDWTGKDFGDMGQDESGAMTAEGNATMVKAQSDAGVVYQSCLYKVTATERRGFPGGPILLSDGSGVLVVPSGWIATHTDLTPDDDSLDELIAISTYRLRPGQDCAGLPIQSLGDLSPSDLLVTLSEVVSPGDATPRPTSFSSVVGGVDPDTAVYACLTPEERSRFAILDSVVFSEKERTISVLVAVGSMVSEEQKHNVIDMLDSLDLNLTTS